MTITLTDPKLARQVSTLADWYGQTAEQLLTSFAQRAIDALTDRVPDLEEMLEKSQNPEAL